MTAQEFNTTLRELLNKSPFEPFAIEYESGARVELDGPRVAFAGGAASGRTADGEIFFFNYNNVRRFERIRRDPHL